VNCAAKRDRIGAHLGNACASVKLKNTYLKANALFILAAVVIGPALGACCLHTLAAIKNSTRPRETTHNMHYVQYGPHT
jgi:integral membrane sensor domain MASE1